MPTSVPGQFLQLVAGANTFFPLGPWGWLFFGFWRFFAVLGQLACNHSATMARGAWCPQKYGAWAARSPQMGTQGLAGGGMAWVPKCQFLQFGLLGFLACNVALALA